MQTPRPFQYTTAADDLNLIIDDIQGLVNLETYSYNKASLNDGLSHLSSIVNNRIGSPDYEEKFDGGQFGDCLHFRFDGTSEQSILFVGHYDTVWPDGTLADWESSKGITEDGREYLSGPGIFDMKTGLVQAIWIAKYLKESGQPFPTVHLLFNGDEELGSPFSRPHIERVAKEVDAAFVFEASHQGLIKTQRKGVGLISVEAQGVESHAGLNPEDGASAITALMEYCLAATQLASPEKGTTINVGLISGGSGSNVVAGKAKAEIDIRIKTQAELERLDKELDEISWSNHKVTVQVKKDWNRPPMEFTNANKSLFEKARTTAEKIGFKLQSTSVGGASDANFVSALGIPVLCGIGAEGAGAHARYEYMIPQAIPKFIELITGTALRIAH
ncbi:M20 family metallopeptidase [Corynebacterium aurimucosum]|uniref:M20 family metallopeptidase n=1 Tax=Corynebacterium aurimucosum TaxID=169292 RepID=UPI00191EA081|nr:M20 family metallopeptidase [Corynebacterium aurimucosum]QQU95544.1 M20 family metallopeptidase [Corynebacterium aurimucosum]UTA71559.1 M20 family metallopeptidase [Corynebacterium aurimucosum]WJY69776.1 Carboxypeptidase G2 precursor [Corynebacterium aurimucosum]